MTEGTGAGPAGDARGAGDAEVAAPPGGGDPADTPRILSTSTSTSTSTPPPPPSAGLIIPRLTFDGSFVGPILPPVVAGTERTPEAAPVSEAVLALPLGTRELVGQALDLLTRSDSGLRSASFYIGFLLLVTVGPVAMLVGLAVTLELGLVAQIDTLDSWPLDGPILLASLVAGAGYLVANVESRALATAVIGGRAEGRPLRLRQSIAVTRRRFWRLLGAMILIGLVTGLIGLLIQLPLGLALGNVEAINYGLSLLVGTLVAAPFVYVPSGIILGEVGALEAIRRSVRLARSRPRLAIVVAMFGILSQFIVLFGVSTGGDVVLRIIEGTGLAASFPPALVVPLAAALTFAFGTLLFLVEAIAAAPAVFAFEALTHYTRGLDDARRHPVEGDSIWTPWMTPGLLLGLVLGLVAIAAGLAGLAAIGA